MEIEKVDYLMQPDPVNEITQCASEDKGESRQDSVLFLFQFYGPENQQYYRAHRCENQKIKGQVTAGPIQESKGHAPVSHVDEIEETGHHSDGLMNFNGPEDNPFGYLVQKKKGQ
jgi:hypothetical protein